VVRVLGRLFLLRAVLLLVVWVGGVRTSVGCSNHGLSAFESESRALLVGGAAGLRLGLEWRERHWLWANGEVRRAESIS
jgi:hypothetical protein